LLEICAITTVNFNLAIVILIVITYSDHLIDTVGDNTWLLWKVSPGVAQFV